MKRILTLLLVTFALTACAQIQPAPPTGSKAYGTTTYISPDGLLWYGTNPLKYRGVYPKTKVDSLLALIPVVDTALYYTKIASNARFVSLTGSYVNPSWIASLDYSKLTGTPTIPVITASNGLTKVTNDIQLGGSMSNSITIRTNTNQFSVKPNVGANGGMLLASSSGAQFGVVDTSNALVTGIEASYFQGLRVLDGTFTKGLFYGGNYDTNGLLDDNWLPSLRAVKGLIAAIPSGNLQNVLTAGNVADKGIKLTATGSVPSDTWLNMYSVGNDGGASSYIRFKNPGSTEISGMAIEMNQPDNATLSGTTRFLVDGTESLTLFTSSKGSLIAASFNGRVEGANATANNQFTTLGQLNAAIAGIDLSGKANTDGSNVSGTWSGLSIGGNAATATKWTNQDYVGAATGVDYFLTNQTGTNNWGYATPSQVRVALGIPSGGETLQSVTDRGSATSNNITAPTFIGNLTATTATVSTAPTGPNSVVRLGDLSNYVDLTTNQTIGGFKTFSSNLLLSKAAGNSRYIVVQTAGVDRWSFGGDNVAETGSNAGSDFLINRFSDAGAYLNTPLKITRTSGAIDITGTTTINGTTIITGNVFNNVVPTNSAHLTNKAYVDGTNTVSSTGTLALTTTGAYTFNGTTATYTLPAITGNTGKKFMIINAGSGTITLNSSAGANDIWESGVDTNTVAINTGETYVLYNNSLKYIIIP